MCEKAAKKILLAVIHVSSKEMEILANCGFKKSHLKKSMKFVDNYNI